MSLCLAAVGKVAKVVTTTFTLIWTNSAEATRWEEIWRVNSEGFTLQSARVKGSSTGMDPPSHARKDGAWYVWNGVGNPQRRLVLARSTVMEDWRLCTAYECVSLELLLPDKSGPVELSYCP